MVKWKYMSRIDLRQPRGEQKKVTNLLQLFCFCLLPFFFSSFINLTVPIFFLWVVIAYKSVFIATNVLIIYKLFEHIYSKLPTFLIIQLTSLFCHCSTSFLQFLLSLSLCVWIFYMSPCLASYFIVYTKKGVWP